MPSSAIMQPFQLLEVSIVSAEDLARVCRNMRTYAVAWVHPDRKLSTRVDTRGHTRPTWHDKFVFRVDRDFLRSDTSYVMVDIYAQHWFKDLHVGTVCVLLAHVLPDNNDNAGTRFVSVQVRRRSGRPQGVLNLGVSVLDSSKRSMPLGYAHLGEAEVSQNNDNGAVVPSRLRRTRSDTSSMLSSEVVVARQKNMLGNDRSGSVVFGPDVGFMTKKGIKSSSSMVDVSGAVSNGKSGTEVISKGKKGKARSMVSASFRRRKGRASSMVSGLEVISKGRRGKSGRKKGKGSSGSTINGDGSVVMGRLYMTDSELGPSASEVAAAMAQRAESEILGTWKLEGSEEGLRTKVERWRAEMHEDNEDDVEGRGCSCFGRIGGLECKIVCGAHPRNTNNASRRHQRSFSESETVYI